MWLPHNWCTCQTAPTSLKQCFLSPCPCILSHLLAYLEEAPWPGWHVDSGLVHSTLLQGSTLTWWRQGWQPCKTSPPLSLQVEILPQGRESPIFKQFFKDWK